MARLLAVFALTFALAGSAAAQQLTLEIANGRVSLDATSVSARQILEEWSRLGGTKIVGAEKIVGAPLTLQLVDVPERQALDIVLRNVAGFMAATRPESATAGASIYDRILILPTAAPAAGPLNANASGRPGAVPGNPMNGTPRNIRVPARPPNLPSVPDVVEEPVIQDPDPSDTGVAQQQPVFTFPGPQGPNGAQQNPVFVPVPNMPGPVGTNGSPVITLTPNANGQPTIYNFVPTPSPPGQVTTPFGVVGSPTPGVIQQPPPQPAQPSPGGTRPPGQRED
jgi:hypothetical protein